MKEYNYITAGYFAESVWNLFSELENKFGSDKAWEFVLAFYKGAGSE